MQLQLAWRRASASAADELREACATALGLPQPLFSLSGRATSELAPDMECLLACMDDMASRVDAGSAWERAKSACENHRFIAAQREPGLQETRAWRSPVWWLLDLRLRLLRPAGALRMAVTACKARASAAGGAFAVLPW